TYDKMSVKEYEEFGRPYDLQILDAIKDNTWFNIMHMHGAAPMFEIMEKYPVQAVNWHDRLVDLSLKEGRSKTDKILIGGVDEHGILYNGSDEDIKAQLKDAVSQVEDGRLILGPGCCVPLNVNEDRLELAQKLLATI
ncbi:uroporphyrinogen decarboxylase family protein, partial [Lutispora sp.]|uniref:uroporphyrinogen decarboxylase family protein n=1 Tax=Lutispora sp. TaxID=2828727 RepID=UPI002B21E1BE